MKAVLLQRIENLQNAIAWSKQHGGLSLGQRICIHQEIAGCLQNLEVEEVAENNLVNTARVSKVLEEKIKHITGVIDATNWKKTIINY